MAATPTTSSTSTIPTVPLELVRIINDVASVRASMSAASATVKATSFTFDPTTTGTLPLHAVGEPTRGFMSSQESTSTPTSTPTLQSENPLPSADPWYQEGWVGPTTWMLLIYCFCSTGLLFMFWLSGCLNWRLDVRYPRIPTSHRSRNSARGHRPRGSQNSIETELGDPEEDDQFEVIRRRWSTLGIHVTVDQLRAQQQGYAELQARRAERERSDAAIVANLRAHGVLP